MSATAPLPTSTKAQLEWAYTGTGMYSVHLAESPKVQPRAEVKPCHGGPLTPSLLALPALRCWALSSGGPTPGSGPRQLSAHTVPHVVSPSLVSNKNQRTLIRGWEVDAGHTKTSPAWNGEPHRTRMWKCPAWARDKATETPALEMFRFESIVIILRAISC